MAADSGNDVIMQYQTQKENYERGVDEVSYKIHKYSHELAIKVRLHENGDFKAVIEKFVRIW